MCEGHVIPSIFEATPGHEKGTIESGEVLTVRLDVSFVNLITLQSLKTGEPFTPVTFEAFIVLKAGGMIWSMFLFPLCCFSAKVTRRRNYHMTTFGNVKCTDQTYRRDMAFFALAELP